MSCKHDNLDPRFNLMGGDRVCADCAAVVYMTRWFELHPTPVPASPPTPGCDGSGVICPDEVAGATPESLQGSGCVARHVRCAGCPKCRPVPASVTQPGDPVRRAAAVIDALGPAKYPPSREASAPPGEPLGGMGGEADGAGTLPSQPTKAAGDGGE